MKKIIVLLFGVILFAQGLFAQKTAAAATQRLSELGKKTNFTAADFKEAREMMLIINNEGRINPNYRREKGCKTALDLPNNLKPLVMSERLNSFAQVQADYQASEKQGGHDNKNFPGNTEHERGYARAEYFNLYVSEACAVAGYLQEYPAGWMNGDSHYRPTWNLDATDPSKPGYPNNGAQYNAVGFGMARGEDGNWYTTAVWATLTERELKGPVYDPNNSSNFYKGTIAQELTCGQNTYILASDGQTYERSKEKVNNKWTWTRMGQDFKSLSCESGHLSAISNLNNSVLYYSGTPNQWSGTSPNPNTNVINNNTSNNASGTAPKEISCGSGRYIILNSDIFEIKNGQQTDIGDRCKSLECSNGKLICIGEDNSRWVYQGSPNNWAAEKTNTGNANANTGNASPAFTQGTELQRINCGSDFIRSSDGKIYELRSNVWTQVGADVTAMNCENGKMTCVHNGKTLRYLGSPNSWETVAPTNTGNTVKPSTSIGNTINKGDIFKEGSKLVSANAEYSLEISAGKLAIFNKTRKIVWECPNKGGTQLLIQKDDGHFCLHNSTGGYVWCAPSTLNTHKAVLENDGRLVVYSSSGSILWSSK